MQQKCIIYDFRSWRFYCSFPWQDESYAEVVSQTIRMKLSEYETSVRLGVYLSKFITLPQSWKDFDKETDRFLSVLSQSVDRYIDHLKRSTGSLGRPLDPFVKYGSLTEIKTLPFPIPQLIPNEPDDKKYQARIYKAFLRIFSYPGLTTCRCEMESERVTALLLHSFFDWFGIMSSSKDGKSDFIGIFKRSPIPTWTTNGFAPIVFMSQPLQSWSQEKQFGHVLVQRLLRDSEAPTFLIPLLSVVQPALQALLVREITRWTQSQKTAEEQFNLPDWLFIHGLFYDTTEIQIYTCTPRITECDANGIPSKWHFACFPLEPYYFRPFSHRDTAARLTAAVTLLKIQRHAARISNKLHSLNLDPVDASVVLGFTSEAEKFNHETVPVPENGEGLNVDIEKRKVQAKGSLLQCMARAGVRPRTLTFSSNEWMFLDSPQANTASPRFLTAFLQNWRPISEFLSLPERWIEPAPEPVDDEETRWIRRPPRPEAESQLQVWIAPQKERFTPISERELHARHFSPDSFAPDFYLSVPARKHRNVYWDDLCISDLSPQTHAVEHFRDVIQYAAYEIDAKFAMSSLFMCTPGCWLKCDTESRFPSALEVPSGPVDFSLLLHPIQTVPINMTPLTPDVALRATILNPALVVGIQGPTLWPSEFLHPSSHIRPKDKMEALARLAAAIEPSLKTHLINWQLRFEQGLTLSRELPPWFMLFGVIYDAQEVTIVAHIPFPEASLKYSYKSCIVDTISFPLALPSSKVTEPWYLDRFRVGLALLSIQKHAFHMAQLWEGVVWPDDLISWEEIVEREHLGPVLTPSERGYMVPPDPMWQMYRAMHGSDEILDDCTPSASEDKGIEAEDMDTGEDSPAHVDEHDTAAVYESDGIQQDTKRIRIQTTGKDAMDGHLHSEDSQGRQANGNKHSGEQEGNTLMNDGNYDESSPEIIQDQQSVRVEGKADEQLWRPSDQNSQPSEGSNQSNITPVEERIESWRSNVTPGCAIHSSQCEAQ